MLKLQKKKSGVVGAAEKLTTAMANPKYFERTPEHIRNEQKASLDKYNTELKDMELAFADIESLMTTDDWEELQKKTRSKFDTEARSLLDQIKETQEELATAETGADGKKANPKTLEKLQNQIASRKESLRKLEQEYQAEAEIINRKKDAAKSGNKKPSSPKTKDRQETKAKQKEAPQSPSRSPQAKPSKLAAASSSFDLSTPNGCRALNEHLRQFPYVGGYTLSRRDFELHATLSLDPQSFPHLNRWYLHISWYLDNHPNSADPTKWRT